MKKLLRLLLNYSLLLTMPLWGGVFLFLVFINEANRVHDSKELDALKGECLIFGLDEGYRNEKI